MIDITCPRSFFVCLFCFVFMCVFLSPPKASIYELEKFAHTCLLGTITVFVPEIVTLNKIVIHVRENIIGPALIRLWPRFR